MAVENESRALQQWTFTQAAREYASNLKNEDLMEATPQARQREITLASLALVSAADPRVHVFNELLIQHRLPRRRRLLQVVPDNMVVVHDGPLEVEGSYDLPVQPTRPLLVMEYVSRSSKRKDYEENAARYEQDLQIPYYLMYHPEIQEITLFRLQAGRYTSVKPDEQGLYAIPELRLHAGLVDGWMRFWYRGELLPLPPELLAELERTRQRLALTEQRLAQTEAELAEERQRNADLLRQLAELQARLPGS